MDQSLRAAPHGLSQLATSFLACPRLGIPRVPLPRLTSSPVPPKPNDPEETEDQPHPAKHLKRSTFPPSPKLSKSGCGALAAATYFSDPVSFRQPRVRLRPAPAGSSTGRHVTCRAK